MPSRWTRSCAVPNASWCVFTLSCRSSMRSLWSRVTTRTTVRFLLGKKKQCSKCVSITDFVTSRVFNQRCVLSDKCHDLSFSIYRGCRLVDFMVFISALRVGLCKHRASHSHADEPAKFLRSLTKPRPLVVILCSGEP